MRRFRRKRTPITFAEIGALLYPERKDSRWQMAFGPPRKGVKAPPAQDAAATTAGQP